MFNEVQGRSTIDQPGMRVINPASLPAAPSFPRKTLILSIAAFLALAAAVVIVFVLEFLDSRFRTPAQVERALGSQLVGMLPLVKGSAASPKSTTSRGPALFRAVIEQPFGGMSEALRTLRTSFALSNLGDGPRVILVTSSMPGEGKTTVSMLLAASSALSGKRTLLVDCDLRRGSASKSLGFSSVPGLTEYLADKGKVLAADSKRTANLVYENKDLSFSMIPCGAEAPNPSDLLGSPRMRDLLLQMRGRYDCIILDAAPVLAVSDAALIMSLVDKVVVIVEWNKTPRYCVVEAIKSMPPEARRISTAVLNKVDYKRLSSYGYGYGQGYNYGAYYRKVAKYYGRG
jgi:capsular exopolysaccharide synthesis family protein